MAEMQFELKGWQAVVGIIILIGLVGVRLATFSDQTNDEALINALKVELMSEYYPDMADKLKAAVDSGDEDEITKAAESVSTTQLSIDSVKASYPLLKFSSPKDVVVKVTYSMNDISGTYQTGTVYYLFKHGGLFNKWRYQHKTGSTRYYLNFL